MSKLINAPHLKEQPKDFMNDLIVLAGGGAWNAWNKGKGTEWLLLCQALQHDSKQNPVILGEKQLKEINQVRIAPIDQQSIKFIQFGELSQAEITALCLNIAKNTKAKIVLLCDMLGQTVENLSQYVERLRNDSATAEIISKATESTPKIKENDRTNEKARAFTQWLGLDLALQRGSREIYHYDNQAWNKLELEDIEEKAVQFFDKNELGYSDRTINSLLNTLKAQLPRMGEQANEFIAFNNGVLNRNTLAFEPHNRNHWLTSYIPHDYDEHAQNTPHFDDWLSFVANGCEKKQQNILAALYAILTNRYNWQLFFELTGKGGSGKSVFAHIATLLAGEQNTISAKLEDFDNAKDLEGFENKTLILCPEQSKYAGEGGGLKAISGGDLLRVNPKHKKPFFTKITALIMLINNEPCRFTERAGGVDRRRVIFDFQRVVPDEKKDPDFIHKVTLEAGGIIRKVLNAFTQPEEAKKALNEQMRSEEALSVKMESDVLTAFFNYFFTSRTLDGLYIGTRTMGDNRIQTHLYPAYVAYAAAYNLKELGLVTFIAGIEQAIKQHNNEYPFIKEKKRDGVRTNIHFKDFNDFFTDVIKR
ncbi:TPA: DNA primase family protein [Pasteurella multocida]|uniref:DNA primase family protein n=1 Tax=Pasteurella multocida TaxID=747 RepID=UPI0020256573|nr:phage/plasmid primase, P4 family [Pasteurella multocida]URJ96976.1 phage/plasmid primase, P4 family [Pasteurella multocida]HDR1057676.1 DNA primase [Pasteurella multocida]HEA3312278.1 DNA primase [Pasteurella multocida]HED4438904.1 DNA primase [Pasteurella multocida]